MNSFYYANPYAHLTFFQFFGKLFVRIGEWISGQATTPLASDEIQMIVLSGIALSSGIIGPLLIFRKMTMLANSLSHTILVGIVLAFVWTFGWAGTSSHQDPLSIKVLLTAALIMGFATIFLTELLTRGAKLQEDASIGIVFTSLFALGVVGVTLLTRNTHIGTEAVMGNVDALQADDCLIVIVICLLNAAFVALFFKEFAITTFDPHLAKALGLSPVLFSYLLMSQVSLTAISAYRAVGVLMFLAFITGPALTARLYASSLRTNILYAMGIGVVASVTGVACSRHLLTVYDIPLSTSGVVVCIIAIFYLLAIQIYKKKKRVRTTRF